MSAFNVGYNRNWMFIVRLEFSIGMAPFHRWKAIWHTCMLQVVLRYASLQPNLLPSLHAFLTCKLPMILNHVEYQGSNAPQL
jgi:hypothetical protein